MLKLLFVLAAAVGGACLAAARAPEESRSARDAAVAEVRGSPVAYSVALVLPLLTVLWYKVKGVGTREAIRAVRAGTPPRDPVMERASARSLRAQLLSDRIVGESRLRQLPGEIVRVEADHAHTQRDLQNAEDALAKRRKAHADCEARLQALRDEKDRLEREQGEFQTRIDRLASLSL